MCPDRAGLRGRLPFIPEAERGAEPLEVGISSDELGIAQRHTGDYPPVRSIAQRGLQGCSTERFCRATRRRIASEEPCRWEGEHSLAAWCARTDSMSWIIGYVMTVPLSDARAVPSHGSTGCGGYLESPVLR